MAGKPPTHPVSSPSPEHVPDDEALPSQRRLGGAEAAVVIVLVVTAAVLAKTGMPLSAVLQLLLGTGLIATVTITALHIRSSRRLRKVMRAVFGAIQ
ncbi:MULTISPECIES: hypothetical protein [unclassified Streptomyces]|uniref:Uncharacterized protein n=1 Tax=Streptomyces sp. NBC_00060 TaxID=2975636 RepID=A0AAU2H8Z4_9ACTN